jgi:hypothetical protein
VCSFCTPQGCIICYWYKRQRLNNYLLVWLIDPTAPDQHRGYHCVWSQAHVRDREM